MKTGSCLPGRGIPALASALKRDGRMRGRRGAERRKRRCAPPRGAWESLKGLSVEGEVPLTLQMALRRAAWRKALDAKTWRCHLQAA